MTIGMMIIHGLVLVWIVLVRHEINNLRHKIINLRDEINNLRYDIKKKW